MGTAAICLGGDAVLDFAADDDADRYVFSQNSSVGDGSVMMVQRATVSIAGAQFLDNSASFSGGAMGNNMGTLVVADSTFTGNSATNGGAMFNSGVLAIGGSTFTVIPPPPAAPWSIKARRSS